MSYRILSLDGGGMRGLLSALLLERLARHEPRLLQNVDLIAGTSSGGLIALGLAKGYSPGELAQLFRTRAPQIFADSLLDDFADLGRLLGADYDNRGLEAVARDLLGDTTLGGLNKRVLITAFDLNGSSSGGQGDNGSGNTRPARWRAKFYHNFPGTDSDAHEPAWQVALKTSAAPTYFPTYRGFADGALAANNPALCALAQSQDRRSVSDPPRLQEVSLLSIGTGTVPRNIAGERHDWGVVQWARPLVDLLAAGDTGVVDYQCRAFLGDRYLRLNPLLPAGQRLPLDATHPRQLEWMESIAAGADITGAVAWLERYWREPYSSLPDDAPGRSPGSSLSDVEAPTEMERTSGGSSK